MLKSYLEVENFKLMIIGRFGAEPVVLYSSLATFIFLKTQLQRQLIESPGMEVKAKLLEVKVYITCVYKVTLHMLMTHDSEMHNVFKG